MSFNEILVAIWVYATRSTNSIIGLIIAILGLFFIISELVTKIRHGTSSENLMLAFISITFGAVLLVFENWLMAIALGLFVLALYQTFQLWNSPVWREFMIISLTTYLVFLVGTVGDFIYELITEEASELFTAWAYNIMIFVFIIMALIFFGKKFVLVSRMMSPQVLYLVLFALIYVALYIVTNLLITAEVIPADTVENLSWFYLAPVLSNSIAERIVFLSLGPYELLIAAAFGMYFISGPLLTKLFGIKPIEDERILSLVEEVRVKMGIKRKLKVGFVEAPILNAMAFGPWFDQRITLICRTLEEFNDDDIRGIVAHELAHNKRLHVVILQVISATEMMIKKALLLPATTLDYSAYRELEVSFGIYFLINYGILAFLYIFVRILEGDADKQTKKAGYGRELAQALYRLEGFYQGVAGDFGVNVQLLTGKEFSEEEKQRFLGEAAIRLYKHVYRPGRWDMIANIFMSHPRSAYRIQAMIDDDLSPIKGALLPYWLILPNFIRGRTIKKFAGKRDDFSDLISSRYKEYFGKAGVKTFLEITRMNELISRIVGREVVAYDQIDDVIVVGTAEGVVISDIICRPLSLSIKDEKGNSQMIQVSDFSIHDAMINEIYVGKMGDTGVLVSYETAKDGNQPEFTFRTLNDEDKTYTKKYTGKPISFLENFVNNEIFFYMDGVDRGAIIKKFKLGKTFSESTFVFDVDHSGVIEEVSLEGKNLLIELPPVLLRFSKDKIAKQTVTMQTLIGKSVILYTKEEIEVGIACQMIGVDEKKVQYKIKDKEFEEERKKIDYIYVFNDIPKIMVKNHVSFVDRLILRLSNRKDMKYIFG
ncbi:MAG: M48 family metalloprotease [Candidatus Heimdallarchaeota archaeon]|nr:M48 family metalloprotease [Candidatus Heimdallarchaeota archaeon]